MEHAGVRLAQEAGTDQLGMSIFGPGDGNATAWEPNSRQSGHGGWNHVFNSLFSFGVELQHVKSRSRCHREAAESSRDMLVWACRRSENADFGVVVGSGTAANDTKRQM
jgi:hypothetical protein